MISRPHGAVKYISAAIGSSRHLIVVVAKPGNLTDQIPSVISKPCIYPATMDNQISHIIWYFHVIGPGIILRLLPFLIRQADGKILPWFYQLSSSSYKQSLLSFFLYPSSEVSFPCPVSETCADRICQIRKTPCVLQNLVRETKISLKPSQYMPLTGQVSVIHCVLPAFACITTGITIK